MGSSPIQITHLAQSTEGRYQRQQEGEEYANVDVIIGHAQRINTLNYARGNLQDRQLCLLRIALIPNGATDWKQDKVDSNITQLDSHSDNLLRSKLLCGLSMVVGVMSNSGISSSLHASCLKPSSDWSNSEV